MGLLDYFKNNEAEKLDIEPAPEPEKTAKEIATEAGEPWVSVIGFEIDPENVNNGAFELDWNEEFVKHLWKCGYRNDTPEEIVDRWFTELCRHVAMEVYEKEEAAGPRIEKTVLLDGRIGYS
ncbi:MAG: hypothetical protein H8D23_39095 [Candidatus Brocadiales bacterium]|nr:hypothetical protein [Candidatus Brocadiales bacterium]